MNHLEVKLISHTPEPDIICAAAAMGCYSPRSSSEIKKELGQRKALSILARAVASGHHSVIEHASFTFSISGVSRALTHQLVRHRMASYSQQSQRYVKSGKPDYVTPPQITTSPSLLKQYNAYMTNAWKEYNHLLKSGIDAEDARFVLPNAATTSITVTMNARELHVFFRLRTCLRSQWEIREMATAMLREAKKAAPGLFALAGPPCNNCPEKTFDCPRKRKTKGR